MLYPSPTWMTIAIVGGDPLVGHALELSLQSAGYDVRFLDRLSINGTLDLFEGLGLVLLAPRISDVDREAVLRRLWHSSSTPARVPVLELIASPDRARDEEEKEEVMVQRMLWPCQLNDLRQKIETVLLSRS